MHTKFESRITSRSNNWMRVGALGPQGNFKQGRVRAFSLTAVSNIRDDKF
jgi:hypothetical protein